MGGTLVAAGALSLNLYLAVRFSRGPSTRSLGVDALRLVWALLFEAAGLAMLAGGRSGAETTPSIGSESVPSLEELDRIEEAVSGLDEAMDELQEALESLRQNLGGSSP